MRYGAGSDFQIGFFHCLLRYFTWPEDKVLRAAQGSNIFFFHLSLFLGAGPSIWSSFSLTTRSPTPQSPWVNQSECLNHLMLQNRKQVSRHQAMGYQCLLLLGIWQPVICTPHRSWCHRNAIHINHAHYGVDLKRQHLLYQGPQVLSSQLSWLHRPPLQAGRTPYPSRDREK